MTDSQHSCQTVAGVWSRLWEEDPLRAADDEIDRTTLVLWTQTPSGVYIDLRLPLGSPGRLEGRKCPEALLARGFSHSQDFLNIIFKQKSFAGRLEFSKGDTTDGKALEKDEILLQLSKQAPVYTCFWKREIDFQPPTGGLDIGVCCNSSGSEIRETGYDGSYAEGWKLLDGTKEGPFLAMELVSENGVARTGFWVRAGKHFAYAIGRPKNAELAEQLMCPLESSNIQQSVGKTLQEAMTNVKENVATRMVHCYVSVFGEITMRTDGLQKCWQILYSTHPDLVGCTLFEMSASDELGKKADSNCSILKPITNLEASMEVEQVLKVGHEELTRIWKVVEVSSKDVLIS